MFSTYSLTSKNTEHFPLLIIYNTPLHLLVVHLINKIKVASGVWSLNGKAFMEKTVLINISQIKRGVLCARLKLFKTCEKV